MGSMQMVKIGFSAKYHSVAKNLKALSTIVVDNVFFFFFFFYDFSEKTTLALQVNQLLDMKMSCLI